MQAYRAGFSAKDSAEIGKFSQMPDQVAAFDATALALNYLSSVVSLNPFRILHSYREMIHRQSTFHSLEGKNVAGIQKRIRIAFNKVSNTDFATMGGLIHLSQDSFHHKKTGSQQSFEPGAGHFDLSKILEGLGASADYAHRDKQLLFDQIKFTFEGLSNINNQKISQESTSGVQNEIWEIVEKSLVKKKRVWTGGPPKYASSYKLIRKPATWEDFDSTESNEMFLENMRNYVTEVLSEENPSIGSGLLDPKESKLKFKGLLQGNEDIKSNLKRFLSSNGSEPENTKVNDAYFDFIDGMRVTEDLTRESTNLNE